MKAFIAICLFAFVGVQIDSAAAAQKIQFDPNEYECVLRGLASAAEKLPQFAGLFAKFGDQITEALAGAKVCNEINEWGQELSCQCEWKDRVTTSNQAISDLVDQSVSSKKTWLRFKYLIVFHLLQLNEEESRLFWSAVSDSFEDCQQSGTKSLFPTEKFQPLSLFFKF